MKYTIYTILITLLLTSCTNAQRNLTNKTFIAETGQDCEIHINGGLDQTYYMILRFQTENKVEINSKTVSLGSINGVKKDTTETHKEGVFNYKLYDNGRLFIDEWFMFNGGIKINEANEIIAIIHSSDYNDKKKTLTFKEIKIN